MTRRATRRRIPKSQRASAQMRAFIAAQIAISLGEVGVYVKRVPNARHQTKTPGCTNRVIDSSTGDGIAKFESRSIKLPVLATASSKAAITNHGRVTSIMDVA